MRFLSHAAAALLIAASSPIALVAPALAQTCVCPPVGAAFSGPVIEAAEPPPPLPVYEQPPMPAPGYHWTPGYWAWNNTDYYWVPGVWVEPPRVGVLWTPPYWGFVGGVFLFHAGYWAPHVGFYGGVNYGYGYAGAGYEGGRWENGQFFYNRAVNNLGAVQVTRVYNQAITVNNTTITRVSYNGGQGGIQVKPTPEQEQVAAEQHIAATPAQITHLRTASVNPEQFHSTNQGRPPVAATARPSELKGPGAVPASTATAVPGLNAPPKGEEKPTPAAPNVERHTLPGVKPAGAEKSLSGEKPLKSEEGNIPIRLQRLPAAGKPLGKPADRATEKPAVKPASVEKPVGQELRPKGMEKPQRLEKAKGPEKPTGPGMPRDPEKPQGLMKPPAERPIVPAISGAAPRPGVAENGMRAGAAERRAQPPPGGKPRECGRPGLPACPR